MKRAQILGISIALGAGILAFLGMQGFVSEPPPAVVQERTINSAQVLVASDAIGLGLEATSASFQWMDWPENAARSGGFITRSARPNARKELSGSIARSPIMKFEPISEIKLIQAGKGGVLAAILPAGMRAISTKITEFSAVGRLILPNDHVDVILIERNRGKNGNEEHTARTIFQNIRVLAIGQQIEAKGDKKNAEGNVATLELTPRQSELLALANSKGMISLSLRSIADIHKDKSGDAEPRKADAGNGVRFFRYGVQSTVYGIN